MGGRNGLAHPPRLPYALAPAIAIAEGCTDQDEVHAGKGAAKKLCKPQESNPHIRQPEVCVKGSAVPKELGSSAMCAAHTGLPGPIA